MQISNSQAGALRDERELYAGLLPECARILELGCGTGEKTRAIARDYPQASILALEVDRIQHEKNLGLTGFPNIRFGVGGAERIPAGDATVDIVFMFKSLHHVPLALMDQALDEIRRVLVPGGIAYISEPVFAGEYNDILRLFHDEGMVRAAAFAALERAVASGKLELVDEIFFNARLRFPDFAAFEEKVIGATHTRHHLSPALLAEVRARFAPHLTPSGAEFHTPMRVDILRKPG
ncbi:class I SAM-dependent methyltransferase [Noviherbaspirillum denitrificans]|uniref:2-polyprenyl-3-methyl-5-hydroxy-6-metoxy-1, 4-benzoquinol methylase n=1 Tax=Noviherbaspirillum denitrificans TaxID=1968433 RepID=A0A254T9W8_9BURK|nr:class I SAM-dependent methyltransferase [Noviherbaspirillum denitrificans]OWW18092.1 2-polyprenyl-3-methyl-5-hydroxy-6-metoxy-1,4-benzoquinol methylase [Noviherbaspirillum denitrificans]